MKFKNGDNVYLKDGQFFGIVAYVCSATFGVTSKNKIKGWDNDTISYKSDGSINGTTEALDKYPEIHKVYLLEDIPNINPPKEEVIELYLDDEDEE